MIGYASVLVEAGGRRQEARGEERRIVQSCAVLYFSLATLRDVALRLCMKIEKILCRLGGK
jgi:hypothetical protein